MKSLIEQKVNRMNRARNIRRRLSALVLFAFVLAACGTTQSAADTTAASSEVAALSSVSNEVGEVTITATWDGISRGPTFGIEMNTHAVDLDGYDLRQLTVLRTGDGTMLQPTDWDAPAGGHHRKGTLTFPTTNPDGQSVIGPATRTIELVIRDVAGVPERIFRWNI